MRAIDAVYDYNAFTMYNWFTASMPGELCAQAIGQNFGTVLMDGAYIGNSIARFSIDIFEPGTQTLH